MEYLLAQVVGIEPLVNLIPLSLSVQDLNLALEEKLLLQTWKQLQLFLKYFDNIAEWSFLNTFFTELFNDVFN